MLCTMRTLQISETVTTLKVDFPVDAQVRPFMSPTRKRDPVSLSSNRRHPLDIATDQGTYGRLSSWGAGMATLSAQSAHARLPVAALSLPHVP